MQHAIANKKIIKKILNFLKVIFPCVRLPYKVFNSKNINYEDDKNFKSHIIWDCSRCCDIFYPISIPFSFWIPFDIFYHPVFCIQKMALWLWSTQFQQALFLESILHATLAQHE